MYKCFYNIYALGNIYSRAHTQRDTPSYKYMYTYTMYCMLYVFLLPLVVGTGRISTHITLQDLVDKIRSLPGILAIRY